MKTNPYEITISAEMLFSGWQSAGIDGSSSHSDRMAWENKSQSERVLSVLKFISNRAEVICAHDNDDITDIKSVAQRVLIECDRVKNGDMLALVRLGERMGLMKTLLAANKAIEFNVKSEELAKEVDNHNEREAKRTSSIKNINLNRKLADEEIQGHAKELFDNDHEQELRTGYVAEILIRNGIIQKTQEKYGLEEIKEAAVRKKITLIAPEYAKKGGAPKK